MGKETGVPVYREGERGTIPGIVVPRDPTPKEAAEAIKDASDAARKVIETGKSVDIRKVSRARRTRRITPAPTTYSSDLLEKTFTSQDDMQKAEQAYRDEQARKAAEAVRKAAERERKAAEEQARRERERQAAFLAQQRTDIRYTPGFDPYKGVDISPFIKDKDKKDKGIDFEPTTTYIGDKEIKRYDPRTRIRYTPGADPETIYDETKTFEIRDIEADQDVGFIRQAKEYLPFGAGAVLTTMQEDVYLPDKESRDRYIELLKDKSPGAGKKLREFLRGQQAQLKKDIGKYNVERMLLETTDSISQWDRYIQDGIFKGTEEQYQQYLKDFERVKKEREKKISELKELEVRIQYGQMGTGWDVTRESAIAAEEKGEDVKLLGFIPVKPTKAAKGLRFGVEAYGVAETVGAITIASTGIGAIAGKSVIGAKVMGTVAKVTQPLAKTRPFIGVGLGIGGYLGEPDDFYASAVGLGRATGFFASAYAKPITEKTWKGMKATDRLIGKYFVDPAITEPKRLYVGVPGFAPGKKITIPKTRITSKPLSVGGQLPRDGREWVRTVKVGLEKKVYISKTDLERDIQKYVQFMKAQGVKQDLINQVVRQVKLDYSQYFPEVASQTITQKVTTPQITQKVTTPQITSIGEMQPVGVQSFGGLVTAKTQASQLVGSMLGAGFLVGQREKEETASAYITGMRAISREKLKPKESEATASSFLMGSSQLMETQTITQATISEPIKSREVMRPGETIKPIKPTDPIRFGLPEFRKRTGTKTEQAKGYDVLIKDNSKWRKVNKLPKSRDAALSKGARIVDNTTADKFRVREIKDKNFDILNLKHTDSTGFNSFGLLRRKFKEVRPNIYKERKQYGKDTRGEQMGITLGQHLKRKGRMQPFRL